MGFRYREAVALVCRSVNTLELSVQIFEKWLTRLNFGLAILAALMLVSATIIISWMVFKRSIGLQNSWELETSIELMISSMFLASPYTLEAGAHVKMDLLENMASAAAERWLVLLPKILACAVCLYLGYEGLQLTIHAYATGERALGVWQPLVWPKYSTVAIGMSLTALRYVIEIIKAVRVLGDKPTSTNRPITYSGLSAASPVKEALSTAARDIGVAK